MSMKHLNVIVEDVLSEAVMRRLLTHVGYTGTHIFRITRGNGQIKKNVEKFGSSAESVGSLRFWQVAKCMIQGDFHHFKVSETVCFT